MLLSQALQGFLIDRLANGYSPQSTQNKYEEIASIKVSEQLAIMHRRPISRLSGCGCSITIPMPLECPIFGVHNRIYTNDFYNEIVSSNESKLGST
jgi:hypothetical protein